MAGIYSPYAHLLWIVPLISLIIYLGTPRFQGQMGARQIRRLLSAALEKHLYTALHGVRLPSGGGSREIDHLLVSQFGIFIIENQHTDGWISGSKVQDRWRRKGWRGYSRFPNPVHQARLKKECVQQLLGLPASKFHTLVIFSGHKGFKTDMPDNVLGVDRMIARIRSKSQKLLSPDQAAQALRSINEARLTLRSGPVISRWQLLRFVLTFVLLAGLWFAYQASFKKTVSDYMHQAEMRASPELFKPDGQRKNAQELWEDSLRCALSIDTGRCVCYEPDGSRPDLSAERCRDLAERGSILKQ
jgi:hypothetical protein